MTGECQNQEWKHQIIYKLETQFHNSVNQNTRKCMENSEFDHISPRMIESSSTREAKWRTENLTQQFLDCLRLLDPSWTSCRQPWRTPWRAPWDSSRSTRASSDPTVSRLFATFWIPAKPAVDNLDVHLDVHLEIVLEVHEQVLTQQFPDCLRHLVTPAEPAIDQQGPSWTSCQISN